MDDVIDRLSDMAKTWLTVVQLAADTHFVVAMRVMGLSGTWSVPEGEHDVMIHEKIPAFTEAAVAGTLTALSGRGPDRVMQAVIEPISRKASANRTRLADRGPRLFGLTATPTDTF